MEFPVYAELPSELERDAMHREPIFGVREVAQAFTGNSVSTKTARLKGEEE